MNIQCPKCGFEQPRDRFCASCGVDIENFKPPHAPLGRRIAGNSFFYVFLALTVVSATIYFVMQSGQRPVMIPENATSIFQLNSPQEPLTQEVKPESGEPTVSDTVESNKQTSDEDPNLERESSVTQEDSMEPDIEAQAGVELSKDGAAQDVGSLRANRAAKAAASVKVTWAEVDSNYFVELFGENFAVGEYRSGLVLDEFNNQGFKTRWEKGRTEGMIRILDSSTHPLQGKDGNKIAIKHTSFDPRVNDSVGVTLTLEPTSIDERGVQMRVQIERKLPVLATFSIDTQTANEDVAIPTRTTAYIAGFLNRRLPDESEKRMFAANAALKLLNSEKFQNRQSELLLFIEPVHSAE